MINNREQITGEHKRVRSSPRARRGDPEETSPQAEANHQRLLAWHIATEDGQPCAPLLPAGAG